MSELSAWLHTMPRGRSVCRISLMKDRERRHVIVRCQVREEARQKLPDTHCLVDDCLRRQRTDIAGHVTLCVGPFKLRPAKVQPPLHRLRLALARVNNEHL